MFTRKLGIIASVALLLSMPVVALASTSRLEGMALPGDYTKDYTAIYGWPACITNVGNLIYGEMGNNLEPAGYPVKTWQNYERAMGAVLPNLWEGRYGVWGLHLREQTPALGQGDNQSGPGAGTNGIDPNTNNNQSFDLMWGKKFGKNSLGLQLNRSYNSLEDEVPGTTITFKQDNAIFASAPNLRRNITGFGGGWLAEMSDKTTAEVSVLYQNRTFEQSATGGGSFKDNGGANYLIGVRMMEKCKANVTVVPVFKYYNIDLSNKTTPAVGASTTNTNTLKGWQIGAAGNWTVGSNDLFVLGATIAQNKLDEDQDVFGLVNSLNGVDPGPNFDPKLTATETLSPELFMSLETQVNSWLTLRFGANKGAWHSVKIEGTTGGGATKETLTYKDSPFVMNTGAGVKMGSLMFDAVLDGLFYQNPFAQLIGSNNAGFANGGGVFTKVSATYNW